VVEDGGGGGGGCFFGASIEFRVSAAAPLKPKLFFSRSSCAGEACIEWRACIEPELFSERHTFNGICRVAHGPNLFFF
jgi:hypothetical protein